MYKFLCFILFLSVLSCSSEKPVEVESQKPSESVRSSPYSLEITPTNVTRNSTIFAIPHGFNLSDAKVDWLVNGIPAPGATIDKFNTSETKKKDKVQARAVIKGKEIMSNIIEIRNSPPEIRNVKVLPEVFKPGDTLGVEASGSDIDGDEVTISYEWTRNGESAGNSKQITGPLKRGDKVDVKLTPFDGEAYGHSVVIHREIANLPPMIIENNKFKFDGKIYTYQVKASDPDGDPLEYSLKSGPSGMTIDPSTGLVKWNVPGSFAGRAQFTVSVADGHGGETSQNFTLDIKSEQKRQKD